MKKLNKLVNVYLKLAQQVPDPELEGPNVRVTPGRVDVNCAIEILKLMDPNYFKGVREVVVAPSSYYGHVESGPEKDPSVINVNADRIVQESGGAQTGPEAAIGAAKVIAHERGHVGSFETEQGFVGGEGPAEQEEARVEQWINANMQRINALPCFHQALSSVEGQI
jgi:hypothetical protein